MTAIELNSAASQSTSHMNRIIDSTGHFSRPVVDGVLKFILSRDRGHKCGHNEETAIEDTAQLHSYQPGKVIHAAQPFNARVNIVSTEVAAASYHTNAIATLIQNESQSK